MSELLSLFGDEVEVCETDALHKHRSLESETLSGIKIGACGIRGRRSSMEDQHVVVNLDDDHTLLGVFDGHGGPETSTWLHRNFVTHFVATTKWQEYKVSGEVSLLAGAFENTFVNLDNLLRLSGEDARSGSCANVCLVTPGHFVCANLGDSRCILGSNDGCAEVALSVDHKPECEEEERRIVAAGGVVSFVKGDVYRVNGQIAVSRSIGDFIMKDQDHLSPAEQFLSCIPHVIIQPRSADHDLLILACDGMWDVLSNDMALERARDGFQFGETSLLRIAEELLDFSYEEGSGDNVSVIVARLPQSSDGTEAQSTQGAHDASSSSERQKLQASQSVFDPNLQGGVDVFRRRRAAQAAMVPTKVRYYEHSQITPAPFSPFADLEE